MVDLRVRPWSETKTGPSFTYSSYAKALEHADTYGDMLATAPARFQVVESQQPCGQAIWRASDRHTGVVFEVGAGTDGRLHFDNPGPAFCRQGFALTHGPIAHIVDPIVKARGNRALISARIQAPGCFEWGPLGLGGFGVNGGLVQLLRSLLTLPSARYFFPDLKLCKGRLFQAAACGLINLEEVCHLDTEFGRHSYLPMLAHYFFPKGRNNPSRAVLMAARLIAWASCDAEVTRKVMAVSFSVAQKAGTAVGHTPTLSQLSRDDQRNCVAVMLSTGIEADILAAVVRKNGPNDLFGQVGTMTAVKVF